MSDAVDITQLLGAAQRGEEGAYDALMPHVYDHLRRLARAQLRKQRPGHTLGTTALVHEAYLRLVDPARAGYRDRGHFLAVASTAMRHILVDYARRRLAQRRGGGESPVTLEEARVGSGTASDDQAVEVLALDEALSDLATRNERLARLVELRFFGGLSVEETAEALDVSTRTVKRDWRKARAILYRALAERGAVAD